MFPHCFTCQHDASRRPLCRRVFHFCHCAVVALGRQREHMDQTEGGRGIKGAGGIESQINILIGTAFCFLLFFFDLWFCFDLDSLHGDGVQVQSAGGQQRPETGILIHWSAWGLWGRKMHQTDITLLAKSVLDLKTSSEQWPNQSSSPISTHYLNVVLPEHFLPVVLGLCLRIPSTLGLLQQKSDLGQFSFGEEIHGKGTNKDQGTKSHNFKEIVDIE